jgi:hypothetical protein
MKSVQRLEKSRQVLLPERKKWVSKKRKKR